MPEIPFTGWIWVSNRLSDFTRCYLAGLIGETIMAVKIESRGNMKIRITSKDDGYIESQTVEANLLFAILEKLEEIRCGIIDVEVEVGKAR